MTDLQLLNSIPTEEFDYVTLTSLLSEYSGVRQKINALLRKGLIIRVKKGLYVLGPNYSRKPFCIEVLANQIYGPSYISLEYALAHHGLIPERVETVTSVTFKRNKEFITPIGRFTYRHLALAKYPYGIEQIWIDKDHPVLMASIEKALCDYIVLHKVPDLTTFEEVNNFLASDLRIDPENWKQFNPSNLQGLNKIYRNQTIEKIIERIGTK